MSLEVELKFRLGNPQAIEAELVQRGATGQAVQIQIDRYFNHPSRDFRSTDEALRVRSIGDENRLTYKGAVIGRTAKTRHEIEIGFDAGLETAERMIELVSLLGFHFVRDVKKTRRPYTLNWNGRFYELALDDVPGLGWFLEIELFVQADDRHQAEEAVWDLAKSLGLTTVEPQSYLHLLLESDGTLG